jgi:hypothetical protein
MIDPIAKLSVVLSDILDSPDKADREKLRDWCRPARPGEADQVDAASGQVVRGLTTAAAHLGWRTGKASRTEYPSWVRLQLTEVLVRFMAGQGRTCMHADPSRPEPWFAAAWEPDLVTCGRCLHLSEPRPGSVKSRTCDQCGHECAGPPDDGIWQGIVAEGPLAFAFGVCDACQHDMPGRRDIPAVGSQPRQARQGPRKRRKP